MIRLKTLIQDIKKFIKINKIIIFKIDINNDFIIKLLVISNVYKKLRFYI